MQFEKVQGLIAAPNTPMNADGSIRPEVIDKQARLLARNGVIGAFICGTMGESLSLTTQERMDVAERWVRAAGRDMKVVVHAGHNSIQDAKALAAHAQKIGAWAAAAMPPVYFRPAGVADLVEFCAQVAAAAPKLPFYYYHIPSMTGVCISVADFLRAAHKRIANLAGIKYTAFDYADFGLALGLEDGRFDMLVGVDETLLCGLALGARGAVGGTYNYAAPLYLRLIEAFDAGDLATARQMQRKSVLMVECFKRANPSSLACSKAIMRMIGLDCGPVRPPLRSLNDQEYDSLRADLERIGFFEFCCK
jgi:N-acetylneuraminate lyase